MKKNIVITGISQGLGLALAHEFCAKGHTVYGCARTLGKAKALQDAYPEHFHFEKVDLKEPSLVNRWAKKVIKKSPKLELLINNASIINKKAPCWELSHKKVQEVMDINVLAVFSCLRAFLPTMINNKKGIVVNISSGWGREATADLSPYCASKFAIEGLTESISKEVPKGIGIISLDPRGGFQTRMFSSVLPEYYDDAPSPGEWAAVSAPYILSLTAKQNGKALTCPSIT
jgi:NAD(P)-dependent dehydrogenase (short-subunit alcohol dehydrogenase family)